MDDLDNACRDWKRASELGLPEAEEFLDKHCRNKS